MPLQAQKEAAMDGYQGNGLFTYTLLDGLNNNKGADTNSDAKVSLVELGRIFQGPRQRKYQRGQDMPRRL